MQGTNDAFTLDELYTHLRCFEEKLKQMGDYHIEPKQVVFPAQSNAKHFHPSTSHENFIQSLDHKVSKDAMLISKMFQGMLNFEKKFNKKREGHDKKVIYFGCYKKGHTIHS
jgi:flagellar biosynthesis chaperone FliJ